MQLLSFADEITDNTLPVVFSDTTQASWKSTDKAAKFEMQVSSLMNGHCPSNLDECCLKFWNKTRFVAVYIPQGGIPIRT